MMRTEDIKLKQGIQLLKLINKPEVSVREAIAVIELITKNPDMIRETIKYAEERGLIKRRKNKIVFQSIDNGETLERVKKVGCEDTCKSCGRQIGNCYYIEVLGTTLGPFGSTCIRKLNIG